MSVQDREPDSLSGCLLRLFWLFLGNVVLAIVGSQMLLHPAGISHLDAIYWSLVVLLLVARYVDIRYFRGTTGDGKPASLRDWRRYGLILLPSAAAFWLAMRLLGAMGIGT